MKRTARVLVGALVPLCTSMAIVQPAAGAEPDLSRYHVQFDSVTVEVFDPTNGPCGQAGTATWDQHTSAAVSATQAGLSEAEVRDLLADDPDGVLRQVATTTTGTVVLVSGPHTYTGSFTSSFGGRFLSNGMYVNQGNFSLRATSEEGTLLRANFGGHNVDGFDGTTKIDFREHGSLSGCLP